MSGLATDSGAEQSRRENAADVHAVKNLRVFKARMPADDGWQYFAAKDRTAATALAGGRPVQPADFNDLQTIALRALTGNC